MQKNKFHGEKQANLIFFLDYIFVCECLGEISFSSFNTLRGRWIVGVQAEEGIINNLCFKM